jgi:hypothetical protein
MNIYGTTKIEYIEFLLKKGVLTLKDMAGDAWNMGTSKKEFAFRESGYPFERDITFEQALNTRGKWMGFRNEFTGYGVSESIFEQVKTMSDWKHYLSLSQIRHSIWERPE